MFWILEVGPYIRVYHLYLWCVVPERFPETKFPVLCHVTNILTPNLVNSVSLLLNLEKIRRLLRVPKEMIKDFISKVKAWKNTHLSNPCFNIQCVKQFYHFLLFRNDKGQEQSLSNRILVSNRRNCLDIVSYGENFLWFDYVRIVLQGMNIVDF